MRPGVSTTHDGGGKLLVACHAPDRDAAQRGQAFNLAGGIEADFVRGDGCELVDDGHARNPFGCM
jgi:hypothetical protein